MSPTTRQVMGWWEHWKLNRRGKRPKHRQRTRREQREKWEHSLAHYTPLPFMIETIVFGGGVLPHSQAQDGMFVLTIGDLTYTPNTFTAGHARP